MLKATNRKHARWHGLAWLPAILLFALISQSSFSQAGGQDDKLLLVVVNSDSIMSRDLDETIVRHHRGMTEDDRLDFDYHKLLDKMVNDCLILQEARALGMDEDPWLTNKLNESKADYAMRLWISDNFNTEIDISHRQIVDYFNKYYYKMHLRTVAVPTRDEAIRLITDIRDGASMDSIARVASLDTKRINGGLHNLKYGADIEIALRDVALSLHEGELSEPFPYRDVFTFLRLEAYYPPDTLEIPIFENRIRDFITAEQRQARWEHFTDSLSSSCEMTVNDPVVKTIKADLDSLFQKEFREGSDMPALLIDDSHFVTERDFRGTISHTGMTNGTLPTDSIYSMALKAAGNELVLKYFSDKEGYRDRPEVHKRYQRELDSSLIEIYLNEMVVSRITFNRQEFQEYYNANPNQFRLPPMIQLLRMELSTQDSADQVFSRLESGADFRYLMKQYGREELQASSTNEWIPIEQFPEPIRSELFELAVGGHTKPFSTTAGWMILYVNNRKDGDIKPIEDVDMEIRKVMFQRRFNELLDQNLSALKEVSTITYFDDNIDRYFGNESK